MKHIFKLLFLNISLICTAFAQDSTIVFFEKGPNNMVRFYYDTDYYLIDKNCEFKFIERVAGFDISSNKFHGLFKDFDINGRTVLTGNYEKGSKEGDFSAYYPNGNLKWRTTFVNNLPQGKIEYFYPDGKPMLTLTNAKSNTYINQFWDKEGNQDIIDGEGKIDITLPIVGFTEHGYTKYNVSGKISNGLQQGLWYTNFVTDNKKSSLVPLMVSSYENGILRESDMDPYFENLLINLPSLTYSPSETFPTAELLQSKNCTFDEHTGFNSYIAQKFTKYLENSTFLPEIDETINIIYTVRVRKKGETYVPTITETSREISRVEKRGFEAMINQVYYYLPSYLENKPIDDKLTVSIQITTSGDRIIIPPVQIIREKGF